MVSPVYIRLVLVLLATSAVIGVAVAVHRSGPMEAAPVASEHRQLPGNIDVSLKNARFSEIQNGVVSWELAAARVDYDKGGDTAYLSGIKMDFPRTPAHGAVAVSAERGQYEAAAKKVRLSGRVHVVTEDDAHFTTEAIVYDGTASRFSTADPVALSQQRLRLTAVGMELGVKNQKARFHSDVNATIAVN